MILNRVSIRNYRQYRNVDIDFAQGDGKNFTIIQGNNGTGKTTLLNCLSWCLYGSEIHDYKDDSSMEICNNKTANLAVIGDKIKVSVELEFLDEGEILAFHRVKGFRKTETGLVSQPSLDKFEVKTQEGNDIKVKANDSYTIERKIPQAIEDYFFFDGARLSEYFQKEKTKKIRETVFSLSQLNLLENASKNLIKVKDQYISKIKQLEPKIGGASEKVSEYDKQIKEAEEDLEKTENDLKEINIEIDNINDELVNKKSTEVKKDAERNIVLDNAIDSNNKKLSKLEAERKKHVLTKYPFILSYESFLSFMELGEKSRQKGYIPPKFKRSFIQDLLDEGKCICGTDLSVDIEHRKMLEQLLEETNPLTDHAEELTVALNQVKEVIMKDIQKFKSRSFEIHSEIRSINEEQEKLIVEKRDVESRLTDNPLEGIERLTNRRKQLRTSKESKETKIKNLKSHIEKLEGERGEQRKLVNKEARYSKEIEEFRIKKEFCENMSKSTETIYKDLKEKMRANVQELTKEKFIKISWKEDEFVDIIIDEDYEVFIQNRLGDLERPGDLSDGEKLCLGLCFMSALHNISGFELPIIMDTPLGNLDVDMRHNIAEFLPQFVGDKQTVLLVTGTEYTDDFRDTIHSSVGKEYMIEWNNSDEGKESKVVLNG